MSSERATQIIESDRASVGNAIHDELLPLIFAASAGIERLKSEFANGPPATRDRLEQVDAWLRQAMLVGRNLLTETYPPELVGTQWVRAATDTVQRIHSDIAVAIDWQLHDGVNDVPMPHALASYRIVIEAIRNAIRHASPSSITVTGRVDDGICHIAIVDDGIGFDPTKIPDGHFGIKSMRSRAELVGGQVTIDSRAGGPTRVEFDFPAAD